MTLQVKKFLAVALLSAASMIGGSATVQAATCPDRPTTGVDRYIDFSAATDCMAAGVVDSSGNKTPDPNDNVKAEDQFTALFGNYKQIAKEEDNNGALTPYFTGLSFNGSNYGTNGSISFNNQPAGYGAFALLFKIGNPTLPDSWFAFSIPAGGFTNGLWKVIGSNGDPFTTASGLSHVTFFGSITNTTGGTVPLPAAGWLLLGGVGALAALRRRRKSS